MEGYDPNKEQPKRWFAEEPEIRSTLSDLEVVVGIPTGAAYKKMIESDLPEIRALVEEYQGIDYAADAAEDGPKQKDVIARLNATLTQIKNRP